MKYKEADTCKHTANTDDFWQEITRQFEPEYYDEPMFVLSPKQTRLLKMAYMGVPKFKHILKRMELGHKFYPIDKNMFERNLFEWDAMGFIKHDDIEQSYESKLKRPAFMPSLPQWDEHVKILKRLIQHKELTPEFAKLWAAYIRRTHLIDYMVIFEPYNSASRTVEENETSEVERYIFALWLHYHQSKGKKTTKTKLAINLATKLDDVIKAHKGPTPWQFTHYNALLNTKDQSNPLLRNATDPNKAELQEYAEDGAFSVEDFPELFSAP